MILGPDGQPLPPDRRKRCLRELMKRMQGLIAVLAATVAGLTLFLSNLDEIRELLTSDSERNREEQLTAIDSYVRGTAGIFDELEEYVRTYPEAYRSLLQKGNSPEEADGELVGALYSKLRQSGNVAQSYSALSAAFPDFSFEGRDWEAIREHNRELFSNFCKAVHEAAEDRDDPAKQLEVKAAFGNYIRFRKAIADHCRSSIID